MNLRAKPPNLFSIYTLQSEARDDASVERRTLRSYRRSDYAKAVKQRFSSFLSLYLPPPPLSCTLPLPIVLFPLRPFCLSFLYAVLGILLIFTIKFTSCFPSVLSVFPSRTRYSTYFSYLLLTASKSVTARERRCFHRRSVVI